MRRILRNNEHSVTGIILHLAWKLALRREEIRCLLWSNIDFGTEGLVLPDRRAPIDGETYALLKVRFVARRAQSEYVVTSDRYHQQMQPQSVSRAARQALDEGGQTGINLEDLRQDCILRLLETKGVAYTARVTGMAVNTLYANYSQYAARELPAGAPSVAEADEFALWQTVQKEGDSPVGLILWMTWQLGIGVAEALALTWEQVDPDAGTISLRDRRISTGTAFSRTLRRVRDSRSPDADPHVLLSARAGKPYDVPQISKLAKTALLRGGVEGMTLDALTLMHRRKDGDELLLRQAEKAGWITRNEAAVLLSATAAQAYQRLRRLSEIGKLVKVGTRYYPAGSVVPPEEHYSVIRAYLETEGGAYRQELAELLHLEARQCTWILKNLVREGKLSREGQRYFLPAAEAKPEKVG